MKTLEELFLDELADAYDAEHRLTRALPKMIKQASHMELREAFNSHLKETEQHVARLEEAFDAFGKKPKARKCAAMIGLIKEADELASDHRGCVTINAALIAAAQKVEHYEIASYGCLLEWARQLNNDVAIKMLQQTLEEEKAADAALTELAREHCNEAAQHDDLSQQEARQIKKGRGTPSRCGSKIH